MNVLARTRSQILTWCSTTELVPTLTSFPISFSFALVLVGMFVSVGTGIVSGFAPAFQASRLDPIEALRYE